MKPEAGQILQRHFQRIGARLSVIERATAVRYRRVDDPKTGERKLVPLPSGRDTSVTLEIRRDRRGPHFEIVEGNAAEIRVIHADPKGRHLVLLADNSKFLCGHDERDWFVAAIPESEPVTSVATAREALKPKLVRDLQARLGVKFAEHARRRTPAYLRQGEWFFVPCPDIRVEDGRILRDEPIRRGRGKPHLCQQLVRVGGEAVYVSRRYPNGLLASEYDRLTNAQKKAQVWRNMVRNAVVYARGAVRHPDHKTVVLPCWYRVEMNTESQSRAMQSVAFLD